jgi:hypothetical protein
MVAHAMTGEYVLLERSTPYWGRHPWLRLTVAPGLTMTMCPGIGCPATARVVSRTSRIVI